MTEAILWTASEAARAIGVEKSTFYRMIRQGRIPRCVEHKATFGQERHKRYSRQLLELWAAGVDIEAIDVPQLILDQVLAARRAS